MMALRIEIAQEAGFANFVDFASASASGSTTGSPTPSGSTTPSSTWSCRWPGKIQEEHRAALGVADAAPLGPAVDPLGRPPLKPFDDVEKLAAGTETIFRDVDPELGAQFAFLRIAAACSTWPTARGRPPAATRRRSRTTACRSSS